MPENQHSKWISPNTELLMMIFIGLVTTVMENSHMNVKEDLGNVWALPFADIVIPCPLDHILKSIISGIVLARSFSVHIYIASYLLLIYPVITEKMRVMLVFWLTLAAIRSIAVNFLAAVTGFILCSTKDELKPVCFEFASVKAIELACSVYMWVIVHDFYYYLKRGKISGSARLRKKRLMNENISSSDSTLTLSGTLLHELDKSFSSEESEISLKEQLKAIEWFMKHVPGFKEEPPLEVSDGVGKFLEMAPNEVAALQDRLRKRLAIRSTVGVPSNLTTSSNCSVKKTEKVEMEISSDWTDGYRPPIPPRNVSWETDSLKKRETASQTRDLSQKEKHLIESLTSINSSQIQID